MRKNFSLSVRFRLKFGSSGLQSSLKTGFRHVQVPFKTGFTVGKFSDLTVKNKEY